MKHNRRMIKYLFALSAIGVSKLPFVKYLTPATVAAALFCAVGGGSAGDVAWCAAAPLGVYCLILAAMLAAGGIKNK